MNQLGEARAHLSEYEKLKGSIQGLNRLSEGISILADFLMEDCSQSRKTVAANLARTYRKDVVEWCQELLSGKAACSAEIDTLHYCRLALDPFRNINELLGQAGAHMLLEKQLLELTTKAEDKEITKKELIDRLLSLSENEQEIACRLLARLGMHIRRGLEREKNRRLKAASGLFAQESKPEDVIRESGQHVYSVHNARAVMVRKAGEYMILKGSTAIKEENDSLPDSARRRRRELLESGALVQDLQHNLLRFTMDIPFKTPSAASCVVSASSTNGWKCFNIEP